MTELEDINIPKFLPTVNPEQTSTLLDPTKPDDTPIFSKRKMVLRIPNAYTNYSFTHLSISKNWVVCLLADQLAKNNTMLRFFLPRAIPPGDIALEKYLAGYKISKLFLDPSGHHTLISLVPQSPGLSADFLYVHGNGPKVRRIEKFKDHEITAVAFNKYAGTESSTGPILLGTSKGLIFETELTQEADKPSFRKQVYDIGLGRTKYPITDLEVLRLPDSNKYVIVATAPDCIYTFQETLKPEEKSLQAVFTSYVNGTRMHTAEEIKTVFNYSVLRFFSLPNEKYPKQWGWLCGAGIRTGLVSPNVSAEEILLGEDLIDLDFEQRKHMSYEERRRTDPKSFVLTEYHALVLYPNRITGICLLNHKVVYEEYFHEGMGRLLNIVRDHFTGAIYVYTEKFVFNFRMNDEKHNLWRIYLSQGLYDKAEFFAADNAENLDLVLVNKAEAFFEKKEYTSSANIFADTNMSFEHVCLKFAELEDKRPIITYVKKKFNKLPEDADTETFALVAWLTDLYLTQINMPGRNVDERAIWQKEFDEFMHDRRVSTLARENRTMIRNLMAEHADSHNLAQFAIANEDYEEVIVQQLEAEKYIEALQTLRKQKDINLFYKYCPTLIEHFPHETVEALIAQGPKIDVECLVPTFFSIDTPKQVEEIIKYLEFIIYNLGETKEAIHNYLLRLYVEHKPNKIMTYLKNEGLDVSLVHYDLTYALSVCLNNNAKVPCVFLQCLLKMWTNAVDLALTFDIQLAKETASKPDDEDLKRKLWLKIAQKDIEGTNDVKKALELLEECDLLRIEDLLPYFSDFERIDDFKEPICKALKEYNQKIQELQHDMDECTKQADRVRSDLQSLRQTSVRIEAQELCSICESFLLVKAFYIFTCGHKFHSDCLTKQVVPMLSSEKSRHLTMLKQQLDTMMTQTVASAGLPPKEQKKRQKVKEEIEEILAADCLYCGLQIEEIDKPFVEDWEQENVDWE